MTLYEPDSVARYFDDFGEREWTRLVESPGAEVKLHVHAQLLRRHVANNSHVLDIGAGPGRFTQILASMSCTVVVADLSPRQLELNRLYAARYNFAYAVTEWRQADICDLSAFPDSAFDAVVCYGGPLSYVFERREHALRELCRVVKPGGYLLLSVMSLWGAIHELLPKVLLTEPADNARIIETGNLMLGPADGTRHQCHLFRADEFRSFLSTADCDLVALSASNALSTAWGDRLLAIRQEPARWAELLAMEEAACAEPGALDMGTHLIAVLRRRAALRS
jgi:SAM-dependent methyltransferase